MDTNEQLRDATDALTAEVHDLSGRLSAKELLYRRTRTLTKVSLGVAVLVGVIAIVAVAALLKVNSVVDCMSEWGDALSERQAVLNTGAEDVAEKKGLADQALRILVDYRGDPNNATTDQAKRDFAAADDARIKAEWRLQFLRDQYPPPQLDAYCSGGGGAKAEETKGPKARGE